MEIVIATIPFNRPVMLPFAMMIER